MGDEPAPNAARPDKFRWWYLPSWLGLDAPCVVSTWTWAVARATGTPLPVRPVAAMFLVVWSIYLTDRIVDVAGCRDWDRATGRLRFGRDRRALFLAGLAVCAVGLARVVWAGLPANVVERAAIVAVGVGLHFFVFVQPVVLGRKLPGKEVGVGLFFALGAFACLGATVQSLPLLISVAVVVAFNCLVIAARDADSDRANDPGGASGWWGTIDRDLTWVGAALTPAAVVAAIVAGEAAFYIALAASFGLLTLLHRFARRWTGDAVRALADFALLTPLPVFGMAAGWTFAHRP